MVASQNTIEEIIRVILKHVDRDTAHAIIHDLQKIDGNKSFRDTIKKIASKIGGG
jgi:hypothetical protein